MSPGPAMALRFGNFEFDPGSGELRKHRLAVRLTPQEKTLLRVLLETPVRVRTREELQRELWPDQEFLDFEHGLNKIVHSLRDALGDSGMNPRFIETVVGSGYRFIPGWLQPYSNDSSVLNCGKTYSIAVLPVMVKSTSSIRHFRAGRMISDLTDSFSAIAGLRVLAQGMVKSINTLGASPQSAGRSMGVRAVLSGELILHETTLFLRMELIDVFDGAQISAVSIERSSWSEQSVEKEVADEIVHHFRPVMLSLIEPGALATCN